MKFIFALRPSEMVLLMALHTLILLLVPWPYAWLGFATVFCVGVVRQRRNIRKFNLQ